MPQWLELRKMYNSNELKQRNAFVGKQTKKIVEEKAGISNTRITPKTFLFPLLHKMY